VPKWAKGAELHLGALQIGEQKFPDRRELMALADGSDTRVSEHGQYRFAATAEASAPARAHFEDAVAEFADASASAPRRSSLDQHPLVLERSELKAGDVLDVAEGRALAVVIRGYYSRAACSRLAGLLKAAADLWTTYPTGSGAEHIGTLGNALYNCLGEELSSECGTYFQRAPSLNRALRAATAPLLLPADRVRIEMDNEWPAGTTLLRIAGRPAFFGLCRFVRSGGGIEPHTDRADWDLPCEETSTFRAQLFLNVYLSQAASGGDLELWDMEITTKAEYDALRSTASSYALDRELLPPPSATIDIDVGTLVIAAASKPHAVIACSGDGQCLSVSGFLGYAGPHVPLRAFS
jgi:hypothetical protein